MALGIADFTAQLAALQAQFKAGTIDEDGLSDGLRDLWTASENIPALFDQMQQVIDVKAAILTAWQAALNVKGQVASVSALPSVAAERDAYQLVNPADPLDRHLFTRVAGVWTDIGPLGGERGASAFEVAVAVAEEAEETPPADEAAFIQSLRQPALTAAAAADDVREATDQVRLDTLDAKEATEAVTEAASLKISETESVRAATNQVRLDTIDAKNAAQAVVTAGADILATAPVVATARDATIAAKLAAFAAASENDAPFKALNGLRTMWSVGDEDGYTPLYLDERGLLHFSNASPEVADVLAQDNVYVVVDEDGYMGDFLGKDLTTPAQKAVTSAIAALGATAVDVLAQDNVFVVLDEDGYMGDFLGKDLTTPAQKAVTSAIAALGATAVDVLAQDNVFVVLDEDGYMGDFLGKDLTTPAQKAVTSAIAALGATAVDVLAGSAIFVVCDEDGFAGTYIGPDGVQVSPAAPVASRELIDILAGGYGFVICDEDGYAYAVGPQDPATIAISRDYVAFERGSAGARDIFLADGARRCRLTYNQSDNYQPQGDATRVKWVTGAADAELMAVEIFPLKAAPVATGVTSLWQVVGTGQSLSVGIATSAAETAPLNPGRAMMFSGGIIPGSPTAATITPDTALSSLLDAYSQARETIGPRLMKGVIAGAPATAGMIYSTHGVNGAPYSTIKKGTNPYANVLRAILRARYLAWLGSIDHKTVAATLVHGEADRAATKATYLGYLTELQSDLQTDMRAITGRSTDVLPLFLCQMSSWTNYNDISTSQVPLAQLEASLTTPSKFVCVGPKYHLPYGADGVHTTATGQRLNGEYYGRAMAAVSNGGAWNGTWTPLRAVSASRAAAVVTVLCSPPSGSLAIDTTLVSDPGNYGVTWTDNGDGNAVTVSAVAVADATHLQITLSATPTGTGGKLQFGMTGTPGQPAGPTTGPRTCIRDSSTDLSAIDGTTHLYNWMCHCEVAVA